MPTAKSSFQVLEGTTVRLNEDSSKPLLELFESYETYIKAWNPERETEYGLFRIPESYLQGRVALVVFIER